MPKDINDLCPVCNGPATGRCRCMRGGRWCAKGHHWHVCKVHHVRVMGDGHNLSVPLKGCTCPKHSTERPPKPDRKPDPKPADTSTAASFVFDIEDPVVRFH